MNAGYLSDPHKTGSQIEYLFKLGYSYIMAFNEQTTTITIMKPWNQKYMPGAVLMKKHRAIYRITNIIIFIYFKGSSTSLDKKTANYKFHYVSVTYVCMYIYIYLILYIAACALLLHCTPRCCLEIYKKLPPPQDEYSCCCFKMNIYI